MKNRLLELENNWYIAKDENNEGVACGWEKEIRKEAVNAFVPSIIQQFFPEYHGLAYYWCDFTPSILKNDTDRLILKFGGVDYKADVWLNGECLGSHEGSEAPFSFDVTEVMKLGEKNLLAVRVLNPCDREIDGINLLNAPHRNKVIGKQAGSHLNHGGVWYGVSLEAVSAAYVKDVFVKPDCKNGDVKISAEFYSAEALCEGEVSVKIYDNANLGSEVASGNFSTSISCGLNKLEACVNVPSFKLWSVDSPNLYVFELELKTKYGTHKYSHKIGFREFYTKDGYFYLNGKKIFLKSAHTGNCFPIGQMFPVRPDHVRKDMIYAKSCGFNMLRSISGMLRPEQIDIADEIGLLIYEECFASWCLGNSQMLDWNDESSYAVANDKFPQMPLGDEKKMLERWRNVTDQMILRDRNHACIVIWGLLNETKNNGVFREAVAYLPRLRELDPTRFAVLNGGRFDYDLSVGSASNPYSNEWENIWWNDGNADVIKNAVEKNKNRNWFVGDNHFYPTSPLGAYDTNLYRNFGKEGNAVFMSECGIGPLFNVIDEYRHFIQYGERLDLEDCSWVEYQSQALERDFDRLGLKKIYPFPELMLRESQKNSAIDRRLMFDAIRSNPKISGYSLTGLLDHGMCGEGLWSYWRHWKKDVFDAVSDGWEPLRFCLFVPNNVYSGDKITLEAVLANDGVLKSGEYTAAFAIYGENGTEFTTEKKFYLDENELAVPVIKETIDVTLSKGRYKFVAELKEAAARGSEIDFVVSDKRDNYVGDINVFAIGIPENAKALLAENGATVTEWNGEKSGILLVDDADNEAVKRVLDAAENGLTVFFVSWKAFSDSRPENTAEAKRVVSDFTRKRYHDWLYHKECVLADKTVFDGLGSGLAVLRDFEGVFPEHIFKTETTPDYTLCPAFQTGYFAVEMSYMLAYAMLGYNFGKGKVFFSSFEILPNVGRPVADRLLTNIVKYLKK